MESMTTRRIGDKIVTQSASPESDPKVLSINWISTMSASVVNFLLPLTD